MEDFHNIVYAYFSMEGTQEEKKKFLIKSLAESGVSGKLIWKVSEEKDVAVASAVGFVIVVFRVEADSMFPWYILKIFDEHRTFLDINLLDCREESKSNFARTGPEYVWQLFDIVTTGRVRHILPENKQE